LDGEWRLRRRAEEAVSTALAALHLYRRDRDYLVQDERVVLVDATTGRAAPGRIWSRGLQQLVELKEGVPLSGSIGTAAQITYQRFFPRYLRLAGMSGTLAEARRELRQVYALNVIPVPLRMPSRRHSLPPRVVIGSDRWDLLVRRIGELHRSGRPVLVGTDTVADSEALAERLAAAGIAHRVLNARQDRDEAATIARAGEARAVTVATRMAGRGTDIVLTLEALALGGLHVIDCQQGQPGRLARQLAGRCARQGEPGSYEQWYWLEACGNGSQGFPDSILARLVRHCAGEPPAQRRWLLRGWIAARQWSAEHRRAALRRIAFQQDLAWAQNAAFAGTLE
jgi:preprotein translocase subunit SecA